MAYTNSVINQITLPTGDLYDVNDAKAFHFLGTTTTDVTEDERELAKDKVLINGNEVVVEANDAVIYGTDKVMYLCTSVNHTAGSIASTWANISPTAADVGDGTITVSGTNVTTQTFTTNQKTDATITVNVPITTIQVNSTELTPSAGVVNIQIPTDSMTFKGTVGTTTAPTSATLADVPTDGSAKVGDAYKVVTDGKYAGNAIDAKVGDLLVCLTKTKDPNANTWVLIPSGDDVDVQSVAAGAGLTTADGQAITTTGTIKAALNDETPLTAAATTGTATDRVFSVVLDTTTTTPQEGGPVTTHNLAVAIPAGNLEDVVDDVTANNTVVKTITAANAAGEGQVAINPFSVAAGVLSIDYLVTESSTKAVFHTT